MTPRDLTFIARVFVDAAAELVKDIADRIEAKTVCAWPNLTDSEEEA